MMEARFRQMADNPEIKAKYGFKHFTFDRVEELRVKDQSVMVGVFTGLIFDNPNCLLGSRRFCIGIDGHQYFIRQTSECLDGVWVKYDDAKLIKGDKLITTPIH